MQVSVNNFIVLDRGDDLSHLSINRRGDLFSIGIPGQAIYYINSCIPVVKVGGEVLGIANIREIKTSISKEGNIMTYVVFSLTKISKEYQKAFKMLYTLQVNTNPIDIDDRFANVDDMIVPGSINAATLDKISGVAGKEKTSGSHLRPSDPSLMEPKSSIAKSFDNLFSDVFQNDDEEDTKRTRKLPSWLDDI